MEKAHSSINSLKSSPNEDEQEVVEAPATTETIAETNNTANPSRTSHGGVFQMSSTEVNKTIAGAELANTGNGVTGVSSECDQGEQHGIADDVKLAPPTAAFASLRSDQEDEKQGHVVGLFTQANRLAQDKMGSAKKRDPLLRESDAKSRQDLKASSLTSSAVHREESIPGAFPVYGTDGEETPSSELLAPTFGQDTDIEALTSHDLSRELQPQQENLTEAKAVTEEDAELQSKISVDDATLPHAEEYDQEEKRESMKRRHIIMTVQTLCLGLAVIIVIVLPVVLLQDNTPNGSIQITESTFLPPTLAPTNASTEDHVLSLLPELTRKQIQEGQTGDEGTESTPQSRAYNWIVADPSLGNYTDNRIRQRYALATLFYATQGFNWFHNDRWLSYSQHECAWFAKNGSGIYWPPDPDPQFPCDATNQTYTKLWLYSNNLQGILPPEIFLLTSLTSLSINSNPRLEARPLLLSSGIGQLTSLQRLDMAGLGLGQQHRDTVHTALTIPTELGLLTHLRDLSLLANSIEGTLPTQLGLLSNLKTMFLDENELSGSIPTDLQRLTSLMFLYLFNNDLSGELPGFVFPQLSHLRQLSLDGNQFSGTLPPQWGFLPNLTAINTNGNTNIVGTIPSQYGLLSKLDRLRLSGMSLEGTIPKELTQLVLEEGGSLLNMDVTGNVGLTGRVPEALCSLGTNTTCPYLPRKPCKLFFDCGALCGCGECPCDAVNGTN